MTETVNLGSMGVRLPRVQANDFADYAALEALNWSTLKHMATSAKLCRWRADNPAPDKEAFRIGRLIHVATLEPERWAREYVLEPDFGEILTDDGKPAKNPKATKAYKEKLAAWKSDLPPRAQTVDPAEHAIAVRCADAIRSHRVTGPLLHGGKAEHTIQWTDARTGVRCKARLDLIATCVLDVKKTRRESVRRFLWDTAELLYHGQTAWYHDGAIASGELPSSTALPLVIGVQDCEPFDVIPLRMTPETYEVGGNLYRALLDKYVQCRAANWWPGLAESELDWTLPSYALGQPGRFEEEQEDW